MTISFWRDTVGHRGDLSMRHLLAAILFALSMFSLPTAAQSPRYLISASPMTDAPSGIQAWRIQYWTTNGSGQRFAATGIVAAPMEAIPPRPRRVLPWKNGRASWRESMCQAV